MTVVMIHIQAGLAGNELSLDVLINHKPVIQMNFNESSSFHNLYLASYYIRLLTPFSLFPDLTKYFSFSCANQ